MKHLKLFEEFQAINESNIVFPSLSQKNIWDTEFRPEMDREGYWGREKPKNHWLDWVNTNSSVGSKTGIDFVPQRNDYPMEDYYINMVGGRMLVYGAAGVAGFDVAKNPWVKDLPSIAIIAARLAERSPKDPRKEKMFRGYEAETPKDMAYTIASTPLDVALEQYENYSKAPEGPAIRANFKKAQKVWDLIAKGKYTPKNLKKDLTIIDSTMKKSI